MHYPISEKTKIPIIPEEKSAEAVLGTDKELKANKEFQKKKK